MKQLVKLPRGRGERRGDGRGGPEPENGLRRGGGGGKRERCRGVESLIKISATAVEK